MTNTVSVEFMARWIDDEVAHLIKWCREAEQSRYDIDFIKSIKDRVAHLTMLKYDIEHQ